MTFGLKNVRATYQRAMNLIFHDLLGTILEVYINDLVIKSAEFREHLVDLRATFERMKRYNLKMNPLKCTFGVSAKRFLGFIVHEQGIKIDPKKIDSIKRLETPRCKRDVQKLLGKVNYLRRFIANLAGKVNSFLPLVCLKHENEITWGEEQCKAFEKIKKYLTSPPVLQAPRVGKGFRLYIATQEHVIGAALTQSVEGKEFVVTYLSRRLIDTKMRYTPIEKLCLSLYYACTKLRCYLLTSSCTIIYQYNIIKYMLQRPILSGRLGKWAYSLVEYDLEYEALKATKGQVLADFIVEHHMVGDEDVCMAEKGAWKLFFDGSICSQGRGIGCFIKPPKGAYYEVSMQ
jgi:hypothetical protein